MSVTLNKAQAAAVLEMNAPFIPEVQIEFTSAESLIFIGLLQLAMNSPLISEGSSRMADAWIHALAQRFPKQLQRNIFNGDLTR